jgi:hypothetical protein
LGFNSYLCGENLKTRIVMFIEVSSNSEKRIINACEIVSVRQDKGKRVIRFTSPVIGVNTELTVDQSYDELLSLLVGAKE